MPAPGLNVTRLNLAMESFIISSPNSRLTDLLSSMLELPKSFPFWFEREMRESFLILLAPRRSMISEPK